MSNIVTSIIIQAAASPGGRRGSVKNFGLFRYANFAFGYDSQIVPFT
jgi:hypothetical protein